jgi:ATP-dependent RNA helicase DDX5/DBP2
MGCLLHPHCRSPQDVQQFLVSNQIAMKGRDIPSPIMYFEEGCVPEALMGSLRRQGFDKPTTIQSVGWPIALSGRDMVGIAQTGSGKTLAVRIV